ncbi:MAG TPA: hypothetical protein VGK24_15425 [Candidatus Angelobacter sp.]
MIRALRVDSRLPVFSPRLRASVVKSNVSYWVRLSHASTMICRDELKGCHASITTLQKRR